MIRERATLAAWVIGPPAVACIVVAIGDLGAIGWPPPPSRWPGWAATTDPPLALAAIVRFVALVGCGMTSLRVGAAIAHARFHGPCRSAGAAIAPGSLQRALVRLARPAAIAGLGVGLATSHPTVGGAAAATPPFVVTQPTPTAPDVDDRGVASQDLPPVSGHAEMRRVHLVLAPFPDVATTAPEAEVWVVDRGDHLWSIAHEILTEHLGRPPDDRHLTRYWQRLIDANLDRLVIPGDPDVIMPGQRLVLPRPGPAHDQRSGT